MAPPGAESKTLQDLLGEGLEVAVDYKSDTEFMGPNGFPFTTITGEDDTSRSSSPFPERGAADTLAVLRTSPYVASTVTVNANTLDEQQQQQLVAHEESAKRRSAPLGRTKAIWFSRTLV